MNGLKRLAVDDRQVADPAKVQRDWRGCDAKGRKNPSGDTQKRRGVMYAGAAMILVHARRAARRMMIGPPNTYQLQHVRIFLRYDDIKITRFIDCAYLHLFSPRKESAKSSLPTCRRRCPPTLVSPSPVPSTRINVCLSNMRSHRAKLNFR